MLRRLLSSASDRYLIAYEDGDLVAALPIFVAYGTLGPVVNSLPYYGSHGAIIARSEASSKVRQELLAVFSEYCEQLDAICATLIESPLDPARASLDGWKSDYRDYRIGQMSPLPAGARNADIEERLLAGFHSKTRNMVRKGLKSGFDLGHDCSLSTLRRLHTLHAENMKAMGGIAKPWKSFEAIYEEFEPDTDYRIYTARVEGEIVSALLVFYFKDTVEYFTPVIDEAYRSQQPLSALIFQAMHDAVAERASSLWNWGGTWTSQVGVYQFKSRWGTSDQEYRYHVRLRRDRALIEQMSPEQLLAMYPFFYTVPFSSLGRSQ
ncbi:MAG: GNAT family N-acetyltransferase [Candidatus Omnitrophota bacterium]|jgi:hypothetical protein